MFSLSLLGKRKRRCFDGFLLTDQRVLFEGRRDLEKDLTLKRVETKMRKRERERERERETVKRNGIEVEREMRNEPLD